MANPAGSELFTLRPDFSSLHGFLAQTAQLEIPLAPDAFTARYGEVTEVQGARDIQNALRVLRGMEGETDPQSLKQLLASDTRALTHPTPPAGLYPRAVWFAQRAGQVAGSMVSSFESLKGLTASGASEHDRASTVRNLFTGEGGLIAGASGVAADAERVASVADAMLPLLTGAVQLFNRTPVLREADDAIRVLESRLNGLRREAGEAEAKSKGFFGRRQAQEESQELAAQVARASVELAGKNRLSTDLQKFLPGSERALPAVQDIAGKLRDVGRIFGQAASRLSSVVSLASDAQLSDYQWLSSAIDLPANIGKWQSVQNASRRFVQDSLVDFDA
jgi:hypothetical protein